MSHVAQSRSSLRVVLSSDVFTVHMFSGPAHVFWPFTCSLTLQLVSDPLGLWPFTCFLSPVASGSASHILWRIENISRFARI